MAGEIVKQGVKQLGDVAQTLLKKETKATRKAKSAKIVSDAAQKIQHVKGKKNIGKDFKGAYGGK